MGKLANFVAIFALVACSLQVQALAIDFDVQNDAGTILEIESTESDGSLQTGQEYTYSGEAVSSKKVGRTWPFTLTLIGPDKDGSISGQIEWPSLNSIHQIKGSVTTTGLTFTETAYIQKGEAVLNCKYYLHSEGNSITGTWDSCDDGDSGTISMQGQLPIGEKTPAPEECGPPAYECPVGSFDTKTGEISQPYGAPLLKSKGCRGACGYECPTTINCEDIKDLILQVPDTTGKCAYTCTWTGVISCGSNEGCREHDACYDRCSEKMEDPTIGDLCHLCCDYHCIEVSGYGLVQCGRWAAGGGPYDSRILYSNSPTMSTTPITKGIYRGLQSEVSIKPPEISQGYAELPAEELPSEKIEPDIPEELIRYPEVGVPLGS
jgi:hypothetical protein